VGKFYVRVGEHRFASRPERRGVVYSFTSPPSGLQQLDLSNFFPMLTNIKGNIPDILTVAITTTVSTPVGVNVICQEAMS